MISDKLGRVVPRLWIVTALTFVSLSFAVAQFPEDALRFATPGIGVGARALAMGNAYTGVASDFSALYYNPAGLAQMEYGEFSIGLSHLNYRDASSFFGMGQSFSNNSTTLNSLGFVLPVETHRGSLVFALGFNRGSNFTTGLSFEGFNPNSSIIQAWAPNGRPYPPDETIAEKLKLADIDTTTGLFISPIRNQVTQLGKVLEGGGLNNWSVAGAIDIAKDLSVGATLTYVSGSYSYTREYREQDNRNIYTMFPFDFDQLIVKDDIESDLTGINGKLGLLFRVPDRFRFGLALKTPTILHVTESFGTSATSQFDTPDNLGNVGYGPEESRGSGEYDVLTPWVFSGGIGVIVNDLILSGDVEYTDWTQLEFRNANPDVIAQNLDIKEIFRPTANLHAGAEYEIRTYGVRVRAGFMYHPSPFEGDPSTFDQKYVTGGLGIQLSGSTMLDLAYARGWWETYRVNYSDPANPPRVNEKITTNNFVLTFSFRY